MDLATAIVTVRDLIGTRSSGGTWDDATLTRYINMAQRRIWRKAANHNPGSLAVDYALTYPASSTSAPIASGGGVYLKYEAILSVFRVPQAGVISLTNSPTEIYPEKHADLEQHFGWADATTAIVLPSEYRYSILANRFIAIRPIPSSALYLILRLIYLPDDLAAGTAEIFAGALPNLHDIVVLHACRLSLQKVREMAIDFARMEEEAWHEIVPFLGGSIQMPTGIRHVRADD